MKRLDRDAMKRAIEELHRKGGADAEQIALKLANEPWADVGRYGSFCCQYEHLQLRPWQTPPCWLRDDDDVADALSRPDDHTGRRTAAEIVKRLLAAGLSRYEPDPLGALATATSS